MSKIELNHYDLEIKEIVKTQDGSPMEVVQLKPALAFDPGFKQEMIEQGVQRRVQYNKDGDLVEAEE